MVKFNLKRSSTRTKTVTAIGLAAGLAATAGIAGAGYGITVRGGGNGGAEVSCPGGMSSLAHVLDESNSIFPGDPLTTIDLFATIDPDGYLVEDLGMATHTGTHLDAPGHFIEGGRTVDDLRPEELVMPLYIIDVRDRMAAAGEAVDFQLSASDIRSYEKDNGKIERGSLVVIQTGFDEVFRTEGYFEAAPGFSGAAVQWLVNSRRVGGIGSDTFGPDSTADEFFDATYTILANDKVAVPGLNNLDSAAVKGDIVMLSPVRLIDGSGFQINPVACHSRNRAGGNSGSHRNDN